MCLRLQDFFNPFTELLLFLRLRLTLVAFKGQQLWVEQVGALVSKFSNTTLMEDPWLFLPTILPSMYFYKYSSIVKNEAAARIVPIDALKLCWGLWMMKVRMAAESDISTISIMHQEIVKSPPLTFRIQVKERFELLVSVMLCNVDQFYYYIA